MGKRFEQFFREDIQMTNEHMKRYSTLLAIKKMQTKTTPTRMALMKKSDHKKCWQECGEGETLVHC